MRPFGFRFRVKLRKLFIFYLRRMSSVNIENKKKHSKGNTKGMLTTIPLATSKGQMSTFNDCHSFYGLEYLARSSYFSRSKLKSL